jgi:Leucine-rich repeat (LRR) protein
LKKLSLARNSISGLWDLPKSLEQVNLSENFIIFLDPVIPSLSKLRFLDISQNCISSLKPLSSLHQLKSLYAGKNKISSTEGLESCSDLTEIDLESNNLQDLSSLNQLIQIPSVSLINIKANPCFKSGILKANKNLTLNSFVQQEDGLFCRNLEKVQSLKCSKFKVVGKNLRKEEISRLRKRPSYRSRITSMQEIYEQVISEDPEMESLNSSGSEERLSLDEFKKPTISKLQLDKIVDSLDKVSCEKWSTKPESSLEFLFEDLVEYCRLDEMIDKSLSSDCRLELVFKILKEREDQRLLMESQKNSNLEILKEIKENSEKLQKELEKSQLEVQKLLTHINDLNTIQKTQMQQFAVKETDYKLKISLLEDERNSSRFNFSYSYDSEFSEDLTIKALSNKSVFVPNEVADYIQTLLRKISRLVSKSKRLRIDNQHLKNQLGSSRASL